MSTVSVTDTRRFFRAWLVIVIAALVASFTVVLSPVAHATEGTDKRAEYAETLKVFLNGQVVDENTPEVEVKSGTQFELEFHWRVGDKPLPSPGDYMLVMLPSWMRPTSTNNALQAGNYTVCSFTEGSREVRCTFTEEVRTASHLNVHGRFKIGMKAIPSQTVEVMEWAETPTNVYKLLAKKESGTIAAPPVLGENISAAKLVKGGVYAGELELDNKRYTQTLWSVLIPGTRTKPRTGTEPADQDGLIVENKITIKEQLQKLAINHPDTGEQVLLPHFFRKDLNISISRRAGDKITNGTWDLAGHGNCFEKGKGKDSPTPVAGDFYHGTDIHCADLIASVFAGTGVVSSHANRLKGESITAEMPRAGQLQDNNEVTITINNPVHGAAYRVTMYTLVPLDLLPSNGPQEPKYKMQNSVEVSGKTVSVHNGFHMYTRASGDSQGDPTRTRVRLVKSVKENVGGIKQNSAEANDIEFPLAVKIAGAPSQQCEKISMTNGCIIDLHAGQSLEVTEPQVVNDLGVWEPGRFTVKPGTNYRTQIQTNENTMTIAADGHVLGEVVTVILNNEFTKPAKVGTFTVTKDVDITPESAATGKRYAFSYTCQKDNDPVIAGEITDVVPGEPKAADHEFLVGSNCVITEKASDADIDGYSLVTPQPQTVTITEGHTPVNARFVNRYVLNTSGFSILKQVEGATPPADTTFSFSYACTKPGAQEISGTVNDVVAGVEKLVRSDIPQGYSCEVAEAVDSGNFDPANYVLSKPGNQTKTIGAQQTRFEFINRYQKKHPLKVVKVVKEGEQINNALAAEKTFDFDYTCGTETGEILGVRAGAEKLSEKKFIAGTQCTVTERVAGAQIDGYTLGAVAPVTVEITDNGQPVVAEMVNTYSRDMAKFQVQKIAVGAPASISGYTVYYTCTDAPTLKREITFKPGETQPKDSVLLPTGTTCELEEKDASAPGYNWTHAITVDGAAVNRVHLVKDATPLVNVTNTYVQQRAGVQVAKTVVNDGARVPTEFAITLVCTDAANAEVLNKQVRLAAGVTSEIFSVPVGAECVVTEADAPEINPAHVAWTKRFTLKKGDGQPTLLDAERARLRIEDENTNYLIQVENTFVQHTGTFRIVKTVVGDQSDQLKGRTFSFDAECGSQRAVIDVKGDGTPVASGLKIPVGTECRVSEKPESAMIDQFDVVLPQPQTFTIGAKDENITRTFENSYTQHTGTFKVSKSVTGANTEALAQREFAFDITCGQQHTRLMVPGTGVAVPSGLTLPVGTQCTVAEDASTAQVQGFDVVTPARKQVVISEKNQDVTFGFENSYTQHKGTFKVAKHVVGDLSDPLRQRTFNFAVTCTDGQKATIAVPGDGSLVDSGIVAPIGTECEIAEDPASAQAEHFDVVIPAPQKLRITQKDQTSTVRFTNHYVHHVGTISLRKEVLGLLPGMANDRTYLFAVTCENGQNTQVKVPATGELVPTSLQIPVGTQCTIAENAAHAHVGGFNLALPAPQTVVISGKGEDKQLTFINEYSIVPWIPIVLVAVPIIGTVIGSLQSLPPFSPPTERVLSKNPDVPHEKVTQKKTEARPGLANTGANVLWVLFGGLLLAALGGILVALRRRES